jgi:hypothetical protein
MLSSASVEGVGRSVEHQLWLEKGQGSGQDNGSRLITKYILTIFAPNNSYKPAILTCKTREEFLKWFYITRRCGYFHEVSTSAASQ